MMERDHHRIDLHSLDLRRVAVVLEIEGNKVVCCGKAYYESDRSLGDVLRIAIDDEPGQEFILSESDWDGVIQVDDRYGCDYCVFLM